MPHAHFLAAAFPMAIERLFDAPILRAQEQSARYAKRPPYHLPDGVVLANNRSGVVPAWPSAAAPALFDVLAVRWHGPAAWERCASCRIQRTVSIEPLFHERKLGLYVPIVDDSLHQSASASLGEPRRRPSGQRRSAGVGASLAPSRPLQVSLRAFTPEALCYAVYQGHGIKSCFGPTAGCEHLRSEGDKGCVFSETEQYYDMYFDRMRFDA